MASKSKPAPKTKVPRPDARSVLIERARTTNNETRQLDFKGEFHDNVQGWCGIVKDVMAMANSGGGIIVFGCHSDGKPSGSDCSLIALTDVAIITDKIFKYTGFHFGDLEVTTVMRGTHGCPAIVVGPADIPTPFSKPGEYEIIVKEKIKPKTEFAAGALYFGHGAKSEPATRAGIEGWIRRHTTQERKAMLEGVKKVVTAPLSHVVNVVPKNAKLQLAEDGVVKVRYSTDPDAIKVNTPALDKSHPYKRAQLITALTKACGVKLGFHDVTSLNHYFKVFSQHRELATKPHREASPQYSDQYVRFLAEQLIADPNLLSTARRAYNTRKQPVRT